MSLYLHSLRFCDAAKALTDLWFSLPRKRGFVCPTKADFNPMKMRQHLKSVALYEIQKNGSIITRVAGTKIEAFLGKEITGKNLLDVLPPEFVRTYQNHFYNLAKFPCAGLLDRPQIGIEGSFHLIKSLQLPLLNNLGKITHFVGIAEPYPLPKHFTDYRAAAMAASRNININYVDIGAGVPEHVETNMARGF